MHGHDVTIFEARAKGGGLNEYGIAYYKTVGGFAEAEVDWLLKIGGITMETGKALGPDLTLGGLREDFDAVFLGMGLSGVNALRANGETREGVEDAVEFISDLRQAGDLGALPVGRNVVVIGGGMTAIDAAVQSKLLGAESVTILYRRGRDAMPASRYEQDLAASKGVRFVFNAMPVEILGNGAVTGVRVEYTKSEGKSLTGTGETFEIAADQVLKAIGQTLEGAPEELELARGKIAVTGAGQTSVAGSGPGATARSGGEDLTVTAVAEGRDAAEDIHQSLSA
jgi:dihydropyrimidine dehydrogenase (NAD+) subunit PreT